MPVDIIKGLPATIRCGDTTIFEIDNAAYPNTDWYYDYIVNRRGINVLKARGVANGTGFKVTIAPDVSAKFTPGRATYFERFTSKTDATQVVTTSSGILTLVPDPSGNMPLSDNQLALAAGKAAVQALLDGGENSSVTFAGQGFTRRNFNDLLTAVDRVQVMVDNELKEMGLGDGRGGFKAIRFRFGSTR